MKILDIPQSGKTNRMVSYKTRHGQFRRRYVVPQDPRTRIQIARRSAMGQARFLWRTLTDQQRAAWNVQASGSRTRPKLNQSGVLSGYLLFIKINCNLALVNAPMVLDPPSAPCFGPNPVVELVCTSIKGLTRLKLRVSGKLTNPILILGTKPRSPGVAYVDHFVILGVLPAPVRGLSDITDLHLAKYLTLEPGWRVFVRTVQLIDGWESLPNQFSVIIPAA